MIAIDTFIPDGIGNIGRAYLHRIECGLERELTAEERVHISKETHRIIVETHGQVTLNTILTFAQTMDPLKDCVDQSTSIADKIITPTS